MSTVTPAQVPADLVAAPASPRVYGWRYCVTLRPDGTEEYGEVPLLRPEDILHPEPGDSIPVSTLHALVHNYLENVFRVCTTHSSTTLVLADTDVYWDDPAVKQHRPDLCVVFHVRNRDQNRASFYVAKEGTRPRVILEIVSPDWRKNDVEAKFVQYHQVGVQVYIILDRVHEDDPFTIRGYQHTLGGYVEMAKDERGRLWLADLGIWLGTEGQHVICYDGATDEPIGDYAEIADRLKATALSLQATADRLQAAETTIAATKEQAEAEQARAAAEQARADAEQARADAEQARAAAEQARADAEAQARRAVETRLCELEAELARLRGQAPSA